MDRPYPTVGQVRRALEGEPDSLGLVLSVYGRTDLLPPNVYLRLHQIISALPAHERPQTPRALVYVEVCERKTDPDAIEF